jgi:hypothetical protein
MDRGAGRLGDRGVKKVGSDGGGGVHIEEKYEEGSHQRPSANARDPDEYPDQQTRQRIERVQRSDEFQCAIP